MMDYKLSFYKTFADELELCRLLAKYCFYQLILFNWWASDVNLNFSKLFWLKNKLISWMADGGVHFQQIFILG